MLPNFFIHSHGARAVWRIVPLLLSVKINLFFFWKPWSNYNNLQHKAKLELKNYGASWRVNWFVCCVLIILMNQDVSSGGNTQFSISSRGMWCAATRNRVKRPPSSAKSDPRSASGAIVFVVANNANSGLRAYFPTAISIETFFVTVPLQRGIRANQWLPRVTA